MRVLNGLDYSQHIRDIGILMRGLIMNLEEIEMVMEMLTEEQVLKLLAFKRNIADRYAEEQLEIDYEYDK